MATDVPSQGFLSRCCTLSTIDLGNLMIFLFDDTSHYVPGEYSVQGFGLDKLSSRQLSRYAFGGEITARLEQTAWRLAGNRWFVH